MLNSIVVEAKLQSQTSTLQDHHVGSWRKSRLRVLPSQETTSMQNDYAEKKTEEEEETGREKEKRSLSRVSECSRSSFQPDKTH